MMDKDKNLQNNMDENCGCNSSKEQKNDSKNIVDKLEEKYDENVESYNNKEVYGTGTKNTDGAEVQY